MAVCTPDLTCKTVQSAKCMSLEGFFGVGKSRKGNETKQACGVRSEGRWVAKYSSVSVGQTKNMTPSYEVCLAATVLPCLYF